MTSTNKWHQAIDTYVETHYGHVMPPYQRDLVKRLAKGEGQAITARPYIYRHCQGIAREVVAVLAAQG